MKERFDITGAPPKLIYFDEPQTGNDLIKLIIQNIKNDLSSRNPVHVNLALHCIANVGTPEMAEAFFSEIPKLLIS